MPAKFVHGTRAQQLGNFTCGCVGTLVHARMVESLDAEANEQAYTTHTHANEHAYTFRATQSVETEATTRMHRFTALVL